MTVTSSFTVDAATAAANATYVSTQAAKKTGSQDLTETDFLKLMTAQMQYQDPFAPMDNSQMVAQMAQFSQLSGQNQTNTTLQSIASALGGGRLSDAANWIGKSMLVTSDSVAPAANGSYSGRITLPTDASGVTVDLVDASGATVKSIALGDVKAGDAAFAWDGKDADGKQASTDTLTIKVRGATPTATAAWTTVAAVQSPASGTDARLITTLGQYVPTDALSLS